MKTILVVGGNRGVGFEVVKTVLKNGDRVAVACKESEDSFPIKNDEKLVVRSFDLRDTNKCLQFVSEISRLWGKIDGAVFYSGVTPISPLTDCTEELFDEIFDVNIKSTFFLVQSLVKVMLKNGGGSLVFFGTSHMESGHIDRAAYAISKGAVSC
jgi:NAD(P)-dependent dehydrogenase (short-subunit alcohol dehydrogenase family)